MRAGARKVNPHNKSPPAMIRKKAPNHLRRASTEVSIREILTSFGQGRHYLRSAIA